MLVKKAIGVVIVDHYKILREALRHVLAGYSDIELLGEAEDGFGAIDLVRKGSVDVIILEPTIPNKVGIDITKEIVALNVKTRILILTVDTTHQHAFRLLRAGAMGWLPKTVGAEEVVRAIRMVHDGKVYLPLDLQRLFAEQYVNPDRMTQPEESLSDREFQVMRLLASGHTNREIAGMLFIGVKTVDTHRANILRKLSLRNNSDITRFAIQHGFVKL